MPMSKTRILALAILSMIFIISGCGTSTSSNLNSFLKADSSSKTIDLNIVAGYNSNNDYINYNGYANGKMVVSIPVGYKVKLHFFNKGGMPAGIGVYDQNQHLAFKGAGEAVSEILENPTPGVVPGDSQTYTFVADKVGTFRMENLINRFPQFNDTQRGIGMWDVLKVTQSGTPGISVN